VDREESFWAWGYEDRQLDDERRQQIAEHLPAVVGFAPGDAGTAPTLADVELAAPRASVPTALADVLTTSHEARVRHTYGRAYRDIVRGFHRDFASAPDAVAFPTSAADVVRVLDHCTANGIAVVPYGGGTSVVGGVECDRDGPVWSLDTTRMADVGWIDEKSRLASIGAGAKGPALERALEAKGLTLRHFPQSFEHSTLGGWIATRAGGHFATLYTHIDDLVASTTTVTPAGTIATRTLPGSGAGPSPDRLILGSEGALGVITEAVVRVRPRPSFRARATVHFKTFSEAVDAARTLAQSDLHPSNCRVLDEREAALNGVAFDRAVLIVAFESDDHPLDAWLARAVEIVEGHGGEVQDQSASDGASTWKAAFVDAPYLQSALVSMGVLVDTFETACTWSAFEGLHAAIVHDVRDAMKRVAGTGRLTCRFTHVYPDGPAPYYTFVCPAKVGSELSQWAEIKSAASEALLANGATITHHHAVGRTHRPWYQRQVPALFLDALAGAKARVDPKGIMNPGVLIDVDGA
jgi:alkyldihydroxyacetonephosphate synthase